MVRGAELAAAEVSDTTAVLLWPARMTWVGPETDHVAHRGPRHRPAARCCGRPGRASRAGRSSLPLAHLDALRGVAPDRMPPDVIDDLVARPSRAGSSRWAIRASSTTPTPPPADLPAYEGPPDPPAGHTHEWGADVAAEAGLPEIGLTRRRVSRWLTRWPDAAGARRADARPAARSPRAIPPIDERDAEQLGRRRRLAEQHHRQADRS